MYAACRHPCIESLTWRMQHAAAIATFVLSDCCSGQSERLPETFEAAALVWASLPAGALDAAGNVKTAETALCSQLAYLSYAFTEPYRYPCNLSSSFAGSAAGDCATPLSTLSGLLSSQAYEQGLQTHGPQANHTSSTGSMGDMLRICGEDSRCALTDAPRCGHWPTCTCLLWFLFFNGFRCHYSGHG